MTEGEFRALRAGDVIAHRRTGKHHRIVNGHSYGERGEEYIRRQQLRGWGPRVTIYSADRERWRVVPGRER